MHKVQFIRNCGTSSPEGNNRTSPDMVRSAGRTSSSREGFEIGHSLAEKGLGGPAAAHLNELLRCFLRYCCSHLYGPRMQQLSHRISRSSEDPEGQLLLTVMFADYTKHAADSMQTPACGTHSQAMRPDCQASHIGNAISGAISLLLGIELGYQSMKRALAGRHSPQRLGHGIGSRQGVAAALSRMRPLPGGCMIRNEHPAQRPHQLMLQFKCQPFLQQMVGGGGGGGGGGDVLCQAAARLELAARRSRTIPLGCSRAKVLLCLPGLTRWIAS